MSSAASAARRGSIHLGRVRAACRRSARRSSISAATGRPSCRNARLCRAARRCTKASALVVQIRREAQGGKAAQSDDGRYAARPAYRADRRPSRPQRRGGAVAGCARSTLCRSRHPHPPSPRAGSTLSRNAGEGAERSEAGEGEAGLRLLEPAAVEALAAETAALAQRWNEILDRASRLVPPARLDPISTSCCRRSRARCREHQSRSSWTSRRQFRRSAAAFPSVLVEHRRSRVAGRSRCGIRRGAVGNCRPSGGGSVHFEVDAGPAC